jgi:predicted DNA-binding protein (MmcQ/YjbR family)
MADEIRRAGKRLREFALGLPGAYEEFPWGERVVKVNQKIFVFFGHDGAARGLRLSVKLPLSRDEALAFPFAHPTGYGLGKSGWISARFSPGERLPVPVLLDWIEESYRAIAPKRLVAQIDTRLAQPKGRNRHLPPARRSRA